MGGFLSALWHRVGECTYLEIYICIGYMMPTIWGEYVTWRYMLILDISCQHLGDECKLGGFCVPFGHGVGECKLLEYIFVLDIWCQQFGEYMSLEDICWYIMPTLEDECKLNGFCVPFGHRVGECTFLKFIFLLDIWCQQFGG